MLLAPENSDFDLLNSPVVLVDADDKQIGLMPKLEAHQKGVLHRAFSVFIFNSRGEVLLQRRAFGKYHSEGLWSNTCCSHPLPDETTQAAALRRLKEEMGIQAEVHFLYSFLYKSELDKGLIEHEFDHVFWGVSDEKPVLNPLEVGDYKYITPSELAVAIKSNPDDFTEWLKICFQDVINRIPQTRQNGS